MFARTRAAALNLKSRKERNRWIVSVKKRVWLLDFLCACVASYVARKIILPNGVN